MAFLKSTTVRWVIGSVVACFVIGILAGRLPRQQGSEVAAAVEVRSIDPDEPI
jgi:hypothetical protein